MLRAGLLLAGLLHSLDVLADGAHPFAAPEASAPAAPGSAAGIGQVTLALAVVLLAVFAIGWLLRRVRGFGHGRSGGIEVLSEIGLSARERAVVVKVGSARLLLGVAPGRVNLLHVLAVDDSAPGNAGGGEPTAVAPMRPTFLSLLQKSLGR